MKENKEEQKSSKFQGSHKDYQDSDFLHAFIKK